ncbi:MAG: hypothetical protein ACR2N4_07435 [Jatrophihabitans sp.]
MMLLGTAATTASAQTPTASTVAVSSQAGALTSAQRAYLDNKIADLLASDPTARRLSINTVAVGGHALAIGAPGQLTVKPIGVAATTAAASCPNLYLCGYHNGVSFKYTACTTHYLSGWTGAGYIFNNQTAGTISYLYKLHNSIYVKDVAKDIANREVNWDPVWSIRVC